MYKIEILEKFKDRLSVKLTKSELVDTYNYDAVVDELREISCINGHIQQVDYELKSYETKSGCTETYTFGIEGDAFIA